MPIIGGGGGGAAAGGGAITLLSTITLGADGTIDFTGIDQSHTDLLIQGNVRGTNAATTDTLEIHVNNDVGTNYQYEQAVAAGAAWTVFGGTASTVLDTIDNALPAATANAAFFAGIQLTFYGYRSTSWNKTMTGTVALPNGTNGQLSVVAGNWLSTAAINRITLFGGFTANLKAGSSVKLYGIG